jgi:hypothetical protein
LLSDGFSSYRSLKAYNHRPKVVGKMAAHVVLPWVHRVFANFKRWALGTYHGVRAPHLRRYLEEFVFRSHGVLGVKNFCRYMAGSSR